MTVAEIDATYGTGSGVYAGVLGPFDVQAVLELIYRIKSFTVEASSEGYDVINDVWESFSLNEQADYFEYPADNESELFGLASWDSPDVKLTLDGPSWVTSSSPSGSFEINTFDSAADSGNFEIIHDENDEYWLVDSALNQITGTMTNASSVVVLITANSEPVEEIFDAQLVLNSGTYPIKLRANSQDGVRNTSLTITGLEWWPYAQNNCEPQWSINNGVYIPDGTPISAFDDPAHSVLIPPLF